MVNVDIDKDLYEDIKRLVRENKLNYPSIRHFVHKMLLDRIEDVRKEKNGFKIK